MLTGDLIIGEAEGAFMGVVDYSGACPGVPALRAAGMSGVARYLSWLPNPKVIALAEYRTLRAAGIGVALVWEYDARDWLSGAQVGAAHAAEAVRQAHALGHPAGAGVYGAADFDMVASQWTSAGRAYAVMFRDGVRASGYRPGVYGPSDVLAWCHGLGFDLFWQAGMSTAWSGGRNAATWPGVHLRQRRAIRIGGVECDWNDVLAPNWGQEPLKRGVPPVTVIAIRTIGGIDNVVLTDGLTCTYAGNYEAMKTWMDAGLPVVRPAQPEWDRIMALPRPGPARVEVTLDDATAAAVASQAAEIVGSRCDALEDELGRLRAARVAASSAEIGELGATR